MDFFLIALCHSRQSEIQTHTHHDDDDDDVVQAVALKFKLQSFFRVLVTAPCSSGREGERARLDKLYLIGSCVECGLHTACQV
jgi:hypothetical protein